MFGAIARLTNQADFPHAKAAGDRFTNGTVYTPDIIDQGLVVTVRAYDGNFTEASLGVYDRENSWTRHIYGSVAASFHGFPRRLEGERKVYLSMPVVVSRTGQ